MVSFGWNKMWTINELGCICLKLLSIDRVFFIWAISKNKSYNFKCGYRIYETHILIRNRSKKN